MQIQHLNEAKEKKLSMKAQKLLIIIKKIRDECGPFLKTEPSLIYRGIQTKEQFGKENVRKDRKPKDTDVITHNILNDIFEEMFGHRLREDSLFATRDRIMAAGYGRNRVAHIIFPIGKYKIYTSTMVEDLFSNLSGMEDVMTTYFMTPTKIRNILMPHIESKDERDEIVTNLSEEPLQIFNKAWLLRNSNQQVAPKLYKLAYDSLKQTIVKMKYQKETNETVEGNELMIVTEKYYFIDRNLTMSNVNLSPLETLVQLETEILNHKFDENV